MKTLLKLVLGVLVLLIQLPQSKAQTTEPPICTATVVSDLNIPSGLTNYLSFSFDSRTILYATRLQTESQYAFYWREKGANSWSEPNEISSINKLITPTTKLGGACFNYNGNVIYFSLDANDGNGMDIYFTQRINNQWSEPQKFDASINTKENESDPSISPDGNLFFFVRDAVEISEFSGDYECKNIFVSEKDNNKWVKAYRLPGQINSGCESSPKISSDNQTLFFSSVKKSDFAFDIYSTKMIAKGIWTDPARVDAINDESSNIYPNVTFDGKEIYAVSQLKKNTKKETDLIFKAELPTNLQPEKSMVLKGKVTNLETNQPMAASIYVINPFTSKLISAFENNPKTGEYAFFLNSKTNYRLDYFGENSSHEITSFEVGALTENSETEQNIQLYLNANLVLNIFDEETFQPLNANIEVFDNETNTLLDIKSSQLFAGRYKIKLPLGKEYKILATQKNYVQDTLIFDIKKTVQFDEFEKDIELAVLKREFFILLKDGQSDSPINSEIVLVNKNRKETIILKSDMGEVGKYKMVLREGDEYEINVLSSKGYAFYNTAIDLAKEDSKEKEIGLLALKADSRLNLNNIVFETNSDELTAVSFSELDRVVELMSKNPHLKVEISAHTDNVGSDVYNLKLSDRRAQSVVRYLTEKGANASNLIAKGYGESKPLVANDTDENKAKNRRVEMSILEEGN